MVTLGVSFKPIVDSTKEHTCTICLSQFLCPDLCITRDEETGEIKIDNDFCKGCGICAFICPKEAITMVLE